MKKILKRGFIALTAFAAIIFIWDRKEADQSDDGIDMGAAKRYPGLAVAYRHNTDTMHPAKGVYSRLDARDRAFKTCRDDLASTKCSTARETEAGQPLCIVWARTGYKGYHSAIKEAGVEDLYTEIKKECAFDLSDAELLDDNRCYPANIQYICNSADIDQEMQEVKEKDRVLTFALSRRLSHVRAGKSFPITHGALADAKRYLDNNMDLHLRGRVAPTFYSVTAQSSVLESPDISAPGRATLEKGSCVAEESTPHNGFVRVTGFDRNGHKTQGYVAQPALRADNALFASGCDARFERTP